MRDYVKYAGILFAITFVTALLLGVVNMFTAPVIEKYGEDKTKAAFETVAEGEIDYSTAADHPVEGESTVQQITSFITVDDKVVYVVKSVPIGYGGDIEMMIGFDSECKVTGVEILKMSETPGLGDNARDNSQWLAQFMGEGQESLDALTGATITSKAIKLGIDDARQQIQRIAGGAEVE